MSASTNVEGLALELQKQRCSRRCANFAAQGSKSLAEDQEILLGNLDVCAALPDSRAAERARATARDVIEYLDSIDYNKYFDSMQKPSARSGEAQAMFLDFSLRSIRAAQVSQRFADLIPFSLFIQEQRPVHACARNRQSCFSPPKPRCLSSQCPKELFDSCDNQNLRLDSGEIEGVLPADAV